MFFKKIFRIIALLVSILMLFGLFGYASEVQELRVAFGNEIMTFDLHNYRGTPDLVCGRQIYETLVTYDKNHDIVPKLATSWEQIDSKTWKFKLREGVKFHDGTPFNAEAVKFSIKRSAAGQGRGYVGFVKEVEIIDDYTVIFHLEKEYGYGPVFAGLNEVAAAMMNPKFVEEKGEHIVEEANGTGPFMLKEFTPGIRTVLIKNKDYWGEPAKLDKIEIRSIPEEGTRIMALRSGEVDLIEGPPPNDIPSLNRDKNLYVYQSPKTRTLFIGFNCKDENIGRAENLAIREAIAHAIDKKSIVDYVLEGLGTQSDTGLIPPLISKGFHDPNLVREFNIEKAKAILKDAGIEEGREIEFAVTRGNYFKDTAIAEVIQSQVSKIGLKLKIQVMETASFFSYLSKFQDEMFLMAWMWPGGEPQILMRSLFFHDGAFNRIGLYYKVEEYEALIDKAATARDFQESMKFYNQAYKIVFDQVGVIPLLNYKNIFAANKKVKGLYVDLINHPYFQEVYIE